MLFVLNLNKQQQSLQKGKRVITIHQAGGKMIMSHLSNKSGHHNHASRGNSTGWWGEEIVFSGSGKVATF